MSLQGVGRRDEAAATAATPLTRCLDELASLHRHVCPRQVLGVRMALHAGELLGIDLPRADRRLFVIVETDGCFADSVSVATGCWLGHRTLRLVDHGKTAATLTDTLTRRSVRVWPHPDARVAATSYAPDAADRWHAQLRGYHVMPAAELLCAQDVRLAVDLDHIRSRPGRRAVCVVCHEDVINERETERDGDVLCRSCAGDRYWDRC